MDPEDAPLETVPVGGGEPTPVDRLVQKTPWWSLSMAIHTLAILFLAYFIVLSRPADAEEPISVLRQPRPLPPTPITRENSPLPDTPFKTERMSEDPMVTKDPDEKAQSMDDDIHDMMKGQDTEFLTRQPFNSRSNNTSIGVGANAAGRKGGPFGGRMDRDGKPGGKWSKRTEEAVVCALRWLARHQSEDGSWGVQSHVGRCGRVAAGSCPPVATAHEDFDAGVTGLALLAFLGAGYSHLSRDMHDGICFGDVVRRTLQWMQTHQDPEGCVGPRTAHKYMYNHAIAALALSEAYGLTGSNLVKDNAQKAIDFLAAAQNPGRGWRYSYKCGDTDTSVTGWAAMALKSAELAGIPFPRTAYDGCRAWLDEVTEENYYRTGYTHRGTGKVYCAHNGAYNHHEALTAIAMMTRMFLDRDRSHARIKGAADILAADLPVWKDNDIDFYYWYYASLALFQFEGPAWKKFDDRMKELLPKHQNVASAGCKAGSWEPVDRWSCEGGRVYATAINALTLEVYYRYGNVFTGTSK